MGRTSHAEAIPQGDPRSDTARSDTARSDTARSDTARSDSARTDARPVLSDPPGVAQLSLYGRPAPVRARAGRAVHAVSQSAGVPLCAGCRAKEARYGFRDEQDPVAARPRTLCFDCFRVEIGRRQAVAARLRAGAGCGWNARQVELPLQQTLEALTRRRRRAQIAARHALGI